MNNNEITEKRTHRVGALHVEFVYVGGALLRVTICRSISQHEDSPGCAALDARELKELRLILEREPEWAE